MIESFKKLVEVMTYLFRFEWNLPTFDVLIKIAIHEFEDEG